MDQKKVDEKAIKGRKAMSHDRPGGKHAMSDLNPQKPDEPQPFNPPVLRGITHYQGSK